MALAFNITAAIISVVTPPAIVGLVGGALSRRWPSARWLAGLCIVLVALLAANEFLWPWGMVPEVEPYRGLLLAAIIGGALVGFGLLLWVSRVSPSRPAA